MKTISASDIRNLLKIEDVISAYSTPVRHNKFCCPFHNDKHASATTKNNRFTCWACGANGSAIDFTMKLFNISLSDACSKLNNDFNLGLGGEKIDKNIKSESLIINKNYDKWIDKLNAEYHKLANIYSVLYRGMVANKELQTRNNKIILFRLWLKMENIIVRLSR